MDNRSKKLIGLVRVGIPLALMPLVIFFGTAFLGERQHLFVSVTLACLSILAFLGGFEMRESTTRRSVVLAIMVALCVVGRIIPIFKPVSAITIIAAIYLGAESGFAVGALAALVSNFIFGQGPWTPFQMLGWGMIGFGAGLLSKPLHKSRVFLVIYGAISGIAYSLVTDVWTVLWSNGNFNASLYKAALISALPHTAIYVISNTVFLFLMAKPFDKKLGRIKIKYGI